jgi:oxysterol-binding protein 1
MYFFTKYACNLNYLDDEMKKSLPPTDCRRRPDQRLMEQGLYDPAAAEKHRLEEKQRAVRKQREKTNDEYRCKYFEQVLDSISGEMMYKYNGRYWDKRRKMDYGDMPDLY